MFAKSFEIDRRIDPGFHPRNVLLAQVDLGAATYTTADRRQFCQRLRARIASQPGVVAASWAEMIPLWFTGVPLETVRVEGYVPRLNESMKIPAISLRPGISICCGFPCSMDATSTTTTQTGQSA